MERKSIVIVRSNPVNPDSRVEKEASALDKAGYDVKILAWDRDYKYSRKATSLKMDKREIKIIRFGIPASYGEGFKNLYSFIRFQIKVLQWLIINRNEYHAIHACDFDTAFTAFVCSKIINKIMVFDIFDYLFTKPQGNFRTFKRFISYLQRIIINNSNGTIICTEKRKEQIVGTTPSKLVVIHNSPPKISQFKPMHLNEEKIKIVYVGILQDYRFLKEIAAVVTTKNECELHIGGFGKYEEYFKELSKKNSNIIFYGKLSYEDTLNLEKNCDIMTAIYDPNIDNHYYAAPNKFYEALMLGKPLIMVYGTGMSEIVKEYDIGELIDFDIKSFEHALDSLIARKNEWKDISAKMVKLYDQKYNWNSMEKKLTMFYDELFDLKSK
jgi:glycosyltransferase involved in cell wall biosynthesis